MFATSPDHSIRQWHSLASFSASSFMYASVVHCQRRISLHLRINYQIKVCVEICNVIYRQGTMLFCVQARNSVDPHHSLHAVKSLLLVSMRSGLTDGFVGCKRSTAPAGLCFKLSLWANVSPWKAGELCDCSGGYRFIIKRFVPDPK